MPKTKLKKQFRYHKSSVDYWSIFHIFVAFFLTWSLLQVGFEIGYVIIFMIFVSIIYEPIEQKYLVGRVFKKLERRSNGGVDILMDILGILLAVVCYLG